MEISVEMTLAIVGALITYSGVLVAVYSVKTKIESTAEEAEKTLDLIEVMGVKMDRLTDTSSDVQDQVNMSQQLLRTNNELIKDNTRAFQSLESAISAFNTTVAILGQRNA